MAFVDTKECASLMGLSPSTLAQSRSSERFQPLVDAGFYPEPVYRSGKPMYLVADIEAALKLRSNLDGRLLSRAVRKLY